MNPLPSSRFPSRRAPTVLNLRRIGIVILLAGLLIVGGVVWVLRAQTKPVTAAVAEAANWPTWMQKTQAYAVPEPVAPPAKEVVHDKTADELAALKAAMARQQQELDALKKRHVATAVAPPPPPVVKKVAPSMLFVDYTPKEGIETKKKAVGKEYTILPGSFIPCAIETAMNSDTGDVTFVAVTTTTVYDTDSGRIPLIVQGSKIVGDAQGSTLVYGNELMRTVSLTLSRRGDETPIDLGHAPVTNQTGINGLASRVDTHFWRLVGAVFIGGALRGGQQALQTSLVGAGGVGPVANGIASTGGQAVTQKIGPALTTRPTIEVDAGQVCNVIVVKPLRLTAAH